MASLTTRYSDLIPRAFSEVNRPRACSHYNLNDLKNGHGRTKLERPPASFFPSLNLPFHFGFESRRLHFVKREQDAIRDNFETDFLLNKVAVGVVIRRTVRLEDF